MADKPGKHTTFFELVDAQAKAGCPVCRLAYRSTDRYLDGLLYEAVLDPTVREKLKSSHGFCREHVTMLHGRPGRSLGVALIYESILRRVTGIAAEGTLEAGTLGDRLRGRPSTGAPLAQSLRPSEPCPACKIYEAAERNYTGLLASSIDDDRLAGPYAEGDGLCVPHLAMTLEQVRDEDTLQRIVQPQLTRYRTMLADLNEYIRKCDHRFRGEPFGPEGDVWLRAMNTMAGGAGMGLSADHGGRSSQDLTERR
ncbi:MAG: DUF6062 family protein [Anaerolineae bacterium]